MMRGVLLTIFLAVVAFAAYVRLVPLNAESWHIDPDTAASPGGLGHQHKFADSALYTATSSDILTSIVAIAEATPRTTLVAGSVAEGRLTFVTRSALWGFPDYTTVSAETQARGTRLAILARGRFGKLDLGVNEARVTDWLARLDAANGS